MFGGNGADDLAAVGWSWFIGQGELERALAKTFVARGAKQSVELVPNKRRLFRLRLSAQMFPAGGVDMRSDDFEDGAAKRSGHRGRIASRVTASRFRDHRRIPEFSKRNQQLRPQ